MGEEGVSIGQSGGRSGAPAGGDRGVSLSNALTVLERMYIIKYEIVPYFSTAMTVYADRAMSLPGMPQSGFNCRRLP
jgi:hypothetical protein